MLRWKHNLGGGAVADFNFEMPDSLRKSMLEIVLNATRAMQIKFCSVDVLLLEDGTITVLEVNSGVMMENLVKQHPHLEADARKLYENVVLCMFDE